MTHLLRVGVVVRGRARAALDAPDEPAEQQHAHHREHARGGGLVRVVRVGGVARRDLDHDDDRVDGAQQHRREPLARGRRRATAKVRLRVRARVRVRARDGVRVRVRVRARATVRARARARLQDLGLALELVARDHPPLGDDEQRRGEHHRARVLHHVRGVHGPVHLVRVRDRVRVRVL